MSNNVARQQFEADFAEFLDELDTVGLQSHEDAKALQELDEAMVKAGIETGTGGAEDISVAQADMADLDPLFFGLVKRRAEALIRKLREYVRKYAKCKGCIPLVTQAAAAFAAKRYPTALSRGLQALNCVRKCI
jgi:hypothetical protein